MRQNMQDLPRLEKRLQSLFGTLEPPLSPSAPHTATVPHLLVVDAHALLRECARWLAADQVQQGGTQGVEVRRRSGLSKHHHQHQQHNRRELCGCCDEHQKAVNMLVLRHMCADARCMDCCGVCQTNNCSTLLGSCGGVAPPVL